MNRTDLVEPLQTAIIRADSSWLTQPSQLRRRLEEELGPDARAHRAQVHQLTVAAEERVPIRLKRNGWSTAERDELVQGLVTTRGWTPAAANWTVTTWAAALGLVEERPSIPSTGPARPTTGRRNAATGDSDRSGGSDGRAANGSLDETSLPGATSLPDRTVLPEATELPGVLAPPAGTVLPSALTGPEGTALRGAPSAPAGTVLPGTAAPQDGTVLPDPPVRASALDDSVPPESAPVLSDTAGGGSVGTAPPAMPAAPLPTRGMGACTKKAAKFLDRPIDVAYDVKTGASPVWLLATLPIGLAAFLVPPVLSGVFLMAFILVTAVGRFFWPSKILAVAGDDIWLIDARLPAVSPVRLAAQGTRDELSFVAGRPFPSVRFGDVRLWFLFPVTAAARQLPTATAP